MTRDEFNDYCKSLKSATNVVQWGDASVWKIGGNVFAIHPGHDQDDYRISFKCSELNFQILIELEGIPHSTIPKTRKLGADHNGGCYEQSRYKRLYQIII